MITNLKRPTAQIKFFIAVFLFFAVIILSFGRGNDQSGQDRLLAGIYLRNALAEYEKGAFSSAGTLADLSISFCDDFSDPHYLKSLLFYRSKLFSKALDEARTALLIGNWKVFEVMDGRIQAARINLVSGSPSSAYLELIPYKDLAVSHREIAVIYVPSAVYSGHIEEAVRVSRAFPLEDFAQKVLAEYDRGWRSEAEARILGGDNTDFYTKPAVRILINSLDLSLCPDFMRYYRKRWGTDRFYLINSLCINGDNITRTLDTIFEDGAVVARDEIFRIKKILDYKNVSYNTGDYFSDKSFTVTDDINGDGLMDVETAVEAGSVSYVSFDKNHDGIPEYKAEFADGKIVHVKIIDGDSTVSAEYRPYPYIVRYSVNDGRVDRTYSLIPYRIKLPVIIPPENPVLNVPRINSYVGLPGNMLLETMASEIKEKTVDGNISVEADRTSLAGTYLVFRDKDGLVFKERKYEGRSLVRESDDIDHDGISDVVYVFEKGELVSASFDLNHNGITEYRELYIPERINEWDFNDDGIFDYRERITKDTKIREYSTGLDGTFDLRLENRENE